MRLVWVKILTPHGWFIYLIYIYILYVYIYKFVILYIHEYDQNSVFGADFDPWFHFNDFPQMLMLGSVTSPFLQPVLYSPLCGPQRFLGIVGCTPIPTYPYRQSLYISPI